MIRQRSRSRGVISKSAVQLRLRRLRCVFTTWRGDDDPHLEATRLQVAMLDWMIATAWADLQTTGPAVKQAIEADRA